MIIRKTLFVTLFILSFSSSFGQLYKHHNWEKTPTYYKLSEIDKEKSSVAIKEKYLVQYYAGVLGNIMQLFETKHTIIRVNSDKGIAKHNRVYIPMRNVKRVIDIKARVIQENGQIKYLNKSNIKELQNVKNYGNFKIFAIEGVTVGSQLEYIYTLENSPTSLGSIVIQKDYYIKKAEVIIRKPSNYSSRIRPYNGFPEMKTKEVEGKKQALTTTISNIPAMTDEGVASPNANRMKVLYQVTNSFTNDENMWNNLENNVKNIYINNPPSKNKTLIKHYQKFSKNKNVENIAEKINSICEYVYANYNIKRTADPNLSKLKNIFRNKQATELGIIKLFCCLFNYENINYEFVLTSNRFIHKFDDSFFSNANLHTGLIYFPDEQMYLRPTFLNSRLGFAPTTSISNNAIFISDTKRFKKIETPKANETIIDRDYDIEINTEKLLPSIKCLHKTSGYRGKNIRRAYRYYNKKDINEFKEFTTVTGIEDAEFESFSVQNENLSLDTKNIPLILNYEYKAESLIEDLDNDFIFNFGKIIGTQTEFYQEAERVNPVELNSLITYKYFIKIKIPKGYEPSNLKDIKMEKKSEIDGKAICFFISDFIVEDGFVKIKVRETYNQLHIPLQYYESYKNVVNAAYDFSNLSILFKKVN